MKKSFFPVLKANPHIDHFHLLEDDFDGLVRELKAEKFDFIVDLHQSIRSRKIRFSLGVASKGFPKLNVKKWLLTSFKIDLMPDIHIVDRYFMAAAPLDVVNDGKGLEYFIPAEDVYDIKNLPPVFEQGYTAFVIGAKHATKRLPEHKIISICKRLGSPVVLLGGPEDAGTAAKIEEACGEKVLSLCGKLNLNQSASMVKQAKVVISHDTGLMHVAAAFRKNIVSIWGNTVPQLGMYPYMPGSEEKSVIIEVKGLKCRPCSKLGYDKCPKGHFRCMEEIDEDLTLWPPLQKDC
jgi:ADP-heptose:LPS heptosyltransferase